jgi:tungstate transport system ATP-binding protein
MTAMRAPTSLLPLRLEGLVFDAGGRRIIRGISITLKRGPRTVVLGPNGAGKSVLLRLCHGLLTPSAGAVTWNAPELPGAPRRQAMVFQRPVLLRRSALGNVRYALKVGGIAAREQEDRAYDALCKVGLEGHADRPARVMSGGEQQRLALARVWALQPEILFLDEPTASPRSRLDARDREGHSRAARSRDEDRDGHAQPGTGAAARRRDPVPASGPAAGSRQPADRFLKQPASAEAAPVSSKASCRGSLRAALFSAFCSRSPQAARGRRSASSPSPRRTSTEQSGLFGHILPIFEKETGIKVRIVALGTGQALDLAAAATPTSCSSTRKRRGKGFWRGRGRQRFP